MKLFHPSVEGAQHGPKGLGGFLKFAKGAGAEGCQPSNFMLQNADGGFLPASDIKQQFADVGLKLDGVSAHCPIWVAGTAWTESKTIRPFIPPNIAAKSVEEIEQWAVDYTLRLLDLCAELGVKVVPMFWGVLYGWEMATGYPWGFWKSPGDYDLLEEGKARFVEKTKAIREKARSLGIVLAHEIHPGTAAMCADDFLMLVGICDGDPSIVVNVDPSHCWEGESWQDRFAKVAKYCVGCHVKSHVILNGFPLRCMEPDWKNRGMQFTDLRTGDINMARFVEQMVKVGYPNAYRKLMGTETTPLVVEAESAYRELDATSADGIKYVRDELCIDVATQSFEEGMGEKKE